MKNESLQRLFDKIDDLDDMTLRIFAKRMWDERSSLQNILNVVREGIVVVNEELFIEFFNNAASDMIGLAKPHSIGDFLIKYLPNASKVLRNVTKNIITDHSFSMHEVEVSYPKKKVLKINIIPYFGEKDDEKKFVVIMTDITKDKQKLEQQIEKERFSSITLLASGVAHELGNPLNAIVLRIQIIQRQLAFIKNSQEKQKIQQSVDICLSEISRLDSIIKNFLQAVRPTNLTVLNVDLKQIILEIKDVVSPELKNNNIEFKTNFVGKTQIFGDFNQLKQVFFNVIKNSAESIHDEGCITIKSRENKNFIEVSIEDTGKGISSEMIDKVFQPYFSTKSTGNGLGMMIVERILREHGAMLDIQSTVGSGTTIIIKFRKNLEELPLVLKHQSK